MLVSTIATLLCMASGTIMKASANPAKRAVPKGFVTTKGSHFELDGKPFVRPLQLASVSITERFRRHLSVQTLTRVELNGLCADLQLT